VLLDWKLPEVPSSKEHKDVVEGCRLGVNSYIVKPVDFDGFASAVSELGLYWLLISQRPKFDG
jgi:two-component system, response regulator